MVGPRISPAPKIPCSSGINRRIDPAANQSYDSYVSMEDIETLKRRHRELEEELVAIDSQVSLTPTEQVARVRLKKEKLAIKDRLLVLTAPESRA